MIWVYISAHTHLENYVHVTGRNAAQMDLHPAETLLQNGTAGDTKNIQLQVE